MQILSNLLASNLSGTNTGDYIHPSGDGNLHVPATGTGNSGKVLTAGASAGALSWSTVSGTGTVTSVSKGNGMNFTSFTTSGTVTLGTPSTLTNSTSNSVTSSSHTHAVTGLIPETCFLLVDTTICNTTDDGYLSAAGQQIQWVKQRGSLAMTSSALTLPAGYLYEFMVLPEIWGADSYVSFDLKNTSTSASVLHTKASTSSGTALGSSAPGYGVLDLSSGSQTTIAFYVDTVTATCRIGQKGGCLIKKFKKVTI